MSSSSRCTRSPRCSSRRCRDTAGPPSRDSNSLVVTHPFHPLAGQRVLILSEYRSRAGGRVYVCAGGVLGHVALPEAFTDRGLPPAPRPVTAQILAELASLVAALRKS